MEQEVGTGLTEGVHPDEVQGCFDVSCLPFHARKPFSNGVPPPASGWRIPLALESGIPRYTGAGEFAWLHRFKH